MVFIVFSMVFTTAVELAFRRDSMLKAQLTKSMFFTLFSMVFTSSVELAFQSHCDFEGSVKQRMVFTVFSKGQSSWLCV